MAKKPTEKQLYKLKNEWLGQFFEEVKPKEFYRAVFPEGSFERAGHFEDGKANGIITIVENDKAKNRIVNEAVLDAQGSSVTGLRKTVIQTVKPKEIRE